MREKVKDLTLLSLHRVSNPKESWLNLNFRQSRHQFLKTFIIIRGHHIACMFHSLSNQTAKCVIHAQLTWGTLIIVSDIQFFTLRMYQLSSKLVKANWLRTVNIWDLKSKSSANRHNQSTKVLAAAIKDWPKVPSSLQLLRIIWLSLLVMTQTLNSSISLRSTSRPSSDLEMSRTYSLSFQTSQRKSRLCSISALQTRKMTKKPCWIGSYVSWRQVKTTRTMRL